MFVPMKRKKSDKVKKELRVKIDKSVHDKVQIQAIKKDRSVSSQVEDMLNFGLQNDI